MQEWEQHRKTVESLYNEAQSAQGDGRGDDSCHSSEEKDQTPGILEHVQAEMRRKYRFEASISQFEAQLGSWGLLKSSESIKTDAASNLSVAPPSPAQAGLRDEPDWIMISTLSKLGLAEHNNISFSYDALREWSTLPYGQLEEQFRSRGINLNNHGSVPGGLSQEMLASVLSSKDRSATQQGARRQEQLGTLASFLPGENATLITGDEVFETNFIRILVFSMLNGFAGLSEIPMDKILKFLNRLVVHSVFLKILEESPQHTSRTLSDNIFRAAIEAQDAKVAKILLTRKLVDVNDTICIFHDHKYTPIQRAASLGALALVRTLVASGADVNKSNPARYPLESILWLLTTGLSPRDYARNLQFRGAVTVTPEILETFDVLLAAGAKVKLRNIMDATSAFATYDLAYRLSAYLDPAYHREFFQSPQGSRDNLAKVARHSDDGDATQLTLYMIDKCNQAGCGKCLAEGGNTLESAVIGGAKRGHINLVKLLLDYVDQEKFMSRVLSAAIISREKDLINLILSRGPELDPPAFRLDNFSSTQATTPVAEAVRAGDDELISRFEAAGVLDTLTEGERFEPLLLAAVEAGNISYVEKLVGRATTSKQQYRDPGSALREAMKHDHEDIAWLLLDAGFGVEERNQHNDALTAAVQKRNRKLVHAILDAGPTTGLSGDLLKAAMEWCDPTVLSDLLAAFYEQCYINDQDLPILCKRCIETNNVQLFRNITENLPRLERDYMTNCLTIAVEMGHTEMIQQLLDLGADPLAPGPLQAAINFHPEILRQLCVDARQPQTARHVIGAPTLKFVMADIPGNSETLETLLESQAVSLVVPRWLGLDQRWSVGADREGGLVTPLGLAIQGVQERPSEDAWGHRRGNDGPAATPCGPNVQAIRRLLQAGSDPNGIAKAKMRGFNQSPLMLAITAGRPDIVELLVDHGADVNQRPSFHTWRSPLQYAAELGSLDMVRLLLRHGADVNGAPHVRGGGTALQFAAIVGSCPLAAELLHHGATLGALPSRVDGRWPLEAAAEHGRLDMIRFLWDVSGRALAKSVYHDGFTDRHCLRAMDFAQKNGHMGCKALIEELSGIDGAELDTVEYGASWLAY